MAEGGNEGFGNGTVETSDYIQFAEDLVNYVMLRNAPDYIVERHSVPSREVVERLFDDNIQRAIRVMERHVQANNMVIFRQMQVFHNVSPRNYTRFVKLLEPEVYVNGFNARNFLIYCASISTMAALFFNAGIIDAPELAQSYIILLLQNHMPADGWNNVQIAAETRGKILGLN